VSWCPAPGCSDLLASCSMDKSVRLWDLSPKAAANPLVHTLPTIGVNLHVRWSACGRWLLLVNEANLVSLISFDPATRKLAVSKSVGISNDINDVEWARDSSRIVLGHHSGFIEVYSVPGLVKESAVAAHGSTIFAMQLDPKGKLLATGGADALVHVWNATELVCLRSFPRLDDSIRALSFSHDSALIAFGGKDTRFEVADVETGERVHLLELTDETLAIAFHPTAPVLAYAAAEKGRTLGDVNLLPYDRAPYNSSASRASAAAASSSNSAKQPGPAAAGGHGGVKAEPRNAGGPSRAAAAAAPSRNADLMKD